MDDVENDGFTREEILEMVKYLKDMDHKMAVACEMLGSSCHDLTGRAAGVEAAQGCSLLASELLGAICKRHEVEL